MALSQFMYSQSRALPARSGAEGSLPQGKQAVLGWMHKRCTLQQLGNCSRLQMYCKVEQEVCHGLGINGATCCTSRKNRFVTSCYAATGFRRMKMVLYRSQKVS